MLLSQKTQLLEVGKVSISDICVSGEEIRASVEVNHAPIVFRAGHLATLHEGLEDVLHFLAILLVVHVSRAYNVCFDCVRYFYHGAVWQNSVGRTPHKSLVVRQRQNGPFSVHICKTVAQWAWSIRVSLSRNTSSHVLHHFYFFSASFFLLCFSYSQEPSKFMPKAPRGRGFGTKNGVLMGLLGGRRPKSPSKFGFGRQSYRNRVYVAQCETPQVLS